MKNYSWPCKDESTSFFLVSLQTQVFQVGSRGESPKQDRGSDTCNYGSKARVKGTVLSTRKTKTTWSSQ